ncbi:MAG: hypothetical protein ABEJ78_10590 [Haloferacaceae archaeon]
MSANNPLTSAFEMQQTMIDQSQRAVETTLKTQQVATSTFFDSFEASKSLQKSGLTLSKRAVEAYLDGLGTVLPEESVEELRVAVDEQYEAVDELHEDAWSAVLESLEEAESSFDELSEAQLRMVEDGFEAMLEMQSDAEQTAEEAVETAERLTESA